MSFLAGKITRRTLHSFFTFCNVCAALMCLYAITNPRWYGAQVDIGTTTRIGLSISPWYTCTRTNELWRCEEFVISEVEEIGGCAIREESTIRSWTYAIRAMVIFTGLSAAFAGILATGVSPMGPNSKKGTYILLSFSIATVLFNIVGIIISAVFYASKLYCDDGFCILVTGNDSSLECKKKFFHGALVYYIGILFPVASLFTSIILVCTHGQAPSPGQLTAPGHHTAAGHHTAKSVAVDSTEPIETQQPSTQPFTNAREQEQYGEAQQELEHIYQPPEGEDWEWDPNSQMYWSEARYMFFRTTDGWFYEPNSQQWYDPNTQQWIADAPQ